MSQKMIFSIVAVIAIVVVILFRLSQPFSERVKEAEAERATKSEVADVNATARFSPPILSTMVRPAVTVFVPVPCMAKL